MSAASLMGAGKFAGAAEGLLGDGTSGAVDNTCCRRLAPGDH
jgi:hypothetical protein